MPASIPVCQNEPHEDAQWICHRLAGGVGTGYGPENMGNMKGETRKKNDSAYRGSRISGHII